MQDDARGLPVNLDAERFVLGVILLDDSIYPQASAVLAADDFSLDAHQRIYRRMGDLGRRGERIDRVTVANELMKFDDLEPCGGLSYLVSLDDGLPRVPNLDSYSRIVKEKSTLRRIVFASQNLIGSAVQPGADPDALIKRAGERFLSLADAQAPDELQTPAEVLEGEIARVGVDAFLSGGVRGIPTPLQPLNDVIVGLQKGDLILLGARPSIGKTALALQCARHAAETGAGCIFFSLEMSKVSLSSRLACAAASVDSQRLRTGTMSNEEKRRFLAAVGALPKNLWIDKSCRTVSAMHAKVRRGQVGHDVGMAVVDYIQLMSPDGTSGTKNDQVSEISRGLKLAAEEFEIPVLALSQLSRPPKGTNPEPALQDLRDSGSLEQDADVVIFLHSPDGKLGTGRRRLIVAKQRCGPVDSMDVSFAGQFQVFSEMARDEAPEDRY